MTDGGSCVFNNLGSLAWDALLSPSRAVGLDIGPNKLACRNLRSPVCSRMTQTVDGFEHFLPHREWNKWSREAVGNIDNEFPATKIDLSKVES